MSEIKELTPEEFRKMQLMQTEMLVELDRVCKENNIKYVITDGTLLGAVRHKGFIPWDDDADVCMLREEYEKFKRVRDQLNPDICYFQDNSTDPYYRWGYGKLRKTGTEFVRYGQEHLKCKTGVFIDVFPMDDSPKTLIGQMLQDFKCFVLRKILWSEVGKYYPGIGWAERSFYKVASKIPTEWVFRRIKKMANKSNNERDNPVRLLMFQAIGKTYVKQPLRKRYTVPKKWYLSSADYEFEGHILQGIVDYDEYLTYEYGDYITLPPAEQREPHAPVSSYKL